MLIILAVIEPIEVPIPLLRHARTRDKIAASNLSAKVEDVTMAELSTVSRTRTGLSSGHAASSGEDNIVQIRGQWLNYLLAI